MSPLQTLRAGAGRRVDLLPMTPMEQLRAGRTVRRLSQLFVGLWLYGTAMALLIRAELGLDPWDVFHFGVQLKVGWSFGTIVIAVGALVLLLWIPLKQWPGLGTVANVIVIGLATDVMLSVLEVPESLVWRWVFLIGGIVVNGLGGALYIGSQYGPGPRDGLMTGFAQRTGLSIRLVRTALEVTVLSIGWVLGGVVGLGTVLYALLIGPTIQQFLPMVTVRLTPPARLAAEPVGSAVDGEREGEHLGGARLAQCSTSDGERPA